MLHFMFYFMKTHSQVWLVKHREVYLQQWPVSVYWDLASFNVINLNSNSIFLSAVTRQSEPPVIRPPNKGGQTASDLQRWVDYLLSVISYVENKSSDAGQGSEEGALADPGPLQEKKSALPESAEMQKAFLIAKIQDLVVSVMILLNR